ncbi:unnamed protein product, partial [Ectocarpus sp. 12 AP-2014]
VVVFPRSNWPPFFARFSCCTHDTSAEAFSAALERLAVPAMSKEDRYVHCGHRADKYCKRSNRKKTFAMWTMTTPSKCYGLVSPMRSPLCSRLRSSGFMRASI